LPNKLTLLSIFRLFKSIPKIEDNDVDRRIILDEFDYLLHCRRKGTVYLRHEAHFDDHTTVEAERHYKYKNHDGK